MMEDRGSPTANHMDHVHVTVKRTAGPVSACSVEPGGDPSTGECGSWAFSVNELVIKPAKCVLRWAFVPRQEVIAGSVSDFQEVWESRPPGNVITALKPVVSSLGAGWSGSCVMPDWSMERDGSLRLPCSPPGGGPGSLVYTLAQAVVIGSTVIYLWSMVAGAVGATGGNAGDD